MLGRPPFTELVTHVSVSVSFSDPKVPRRIHHAAGFTVPRPLPPGWAEIKAVMGRLRPVVFLPNSGERASLLF